MRIPDETFGVSLTADEIEMLLNAISYEKAENSTLTDDGWDLVPFEPEEV